MPQPHIIELGGLSATAEGVAADTVVVLLHGHSMQPADLSPFAPPLSLPALFLFPQGPVSVQPQGHAWWPVDMAAKMRTLQSGPRDLHDRIPQGLEAARAQLDAFLSAVRRELKPAKLILGGFSQGAMLACDWLHHHPQERPDALVLLSASRINIYDWRSCPVSLDSLPILLSHGRQDPDLAFAAGEGLRDHLQAIGGAVTWTPFDGGHEIPLVVWRALRRFLQPFRSAHSITV